jgi:hypothetical protein
MWLAWRCNVADRWAGSLVIPHAFVMHVGLCHSTMKRGFVDPYCVVPTKRVLFSLAFFSTQSRMMLQQLQVFHGRCILKPKQSSERKK